MEGALGGILALGLGPADIESVDPDSVKAVSVGGIASEAHQARFRGHVRRQIGLSAVCGEGDDVDDRSGCLTAAHVLHGGLHDEERCPQIDGDMSVEEFDVGVQQCSTRGNTGGVDDAVNPAVASHGGGHGTGSGQRIGKINSLEAYVGPVAGKLSGNGLTRRRVAPRDHDPSRSSGCGRSGDASAESTSSSADQDDLVLEEHRRQTSVSSRCDDPSGTVRPVWRLSSAASASANASRPSANPGLGWLPCSIAVIK